ncbi:MAG TPA: EGF domain-containing protein [Myxococcota bacterium]|nr:EGF domain-containing protein [Myxococcota bacterium]
MGSNRSLRNPFSLYLVLWLAAVTAASCASGNVDDPSDSGTECEEGYTHDGTSCLDDNECIGEGSGHNCHADATCTNIPGGFSCACNVGYTGDGTDCSDIDECETDNGGCDPLVTCTNTMGGRTCGNCPDPYTNGADGVCQCVNTGLWPPNGPTPRSMPDMTNLALGATYTLDPAPNYALCTDPDDTVQLTDGVYTEGYFWTQASTVGWSRRNPIVVVDLGADRPVRGVSYNTAAGVAGVEWPKAVYLFVAGADQVFHQAGDLVALHHRHEIPPADGYAIHRYWTDELHTHGRYLALAIVASPYLFVDEIEVFEGEQAWLAEPIAGEAVEDLGGAVSANQVRAQMVERFYSDMATLLQKADDLAVPAEVRDEILCEWDSVMAMLENMIPEPDFRAVLPFDLLHERVLAVQARLWRFGGWPELTVWQSATWDNLPYLADPPRDASASLSVDLIQHEFRAAQLNLSNAGPRLKQVRLRVEGLPGGANPSRLTVHEVAWTDTADGIPVSDALPDAMREGDHYTIHVPSGLTRQVWFTFFLDGVTPGEHAGTIVLDDGSGERQVPLSLHVYPFVFPTERHLHLGGWDYTNRASHRGITEQNRALVVTHLVEHFVDRPWATSSVMPRGSYDGDGHLTTDPDTTEFDAWLDLWPGADGYEVFASVSDSMAGHAAATPEFATAVGEWALFWSAHAQARGLAPDRLAVLLVDEPHEAGQDATILAWADAIHASGANLRVWEDPTYSDIRDADPRMIAACDILCPNRQIFLAGGTAYAEYVADRRAAGTTLEFYSCSGPVRLLDPYSYHRMQAWTAWQHGANTMHFWAFSDNGGVSSWNEYALLSARGYSPSFMDDTSITTSKHMEAVREGVQDYEYLYMLQAAIAEAETNGVDPVLVQQARDLLDGLPSAVLPPPDTSIYWADELDRTAADTARAEILEMLTALAP